MNTESNALLEVDAPTLRAWLDAGEARLIDVRERDEHIAERIPRATIEPLSSFDPSRVRAENGQRLVLHCKAGRRSGEAGARLIAAGHVGVHHLAGGIDAWKQAGFDTVSQAKVPISIMRQVQITAGSLVVLGVALGLLVSPWLYGLSAFVGAGLVFAGLSGTCGMASLLSLAPWNRAFRQGGACVAPASP